ncbi:hypothetical protein BDF20DRAFT_840056 [Mycotypha africana]|uniref:uncharacterized protein n=1 Tax=Mycotypha africana TaxID=64632 RepID=UPI00230135BF|nr:uncharacterized protein BDF20DRAFT_840056 [Mycotypha africana]KAI8967496.1 hypothetical protein BDF20DRAFT_840056 [Mycotypha africana]
MNLNNHYSINNTVAPSSIGHGARPLSSRSFSAPSSTSNNIDYEDLKRRIESGEKLQPRILGLAVIHRARVERNFSSALYFYDQLQKVIRELIDRPGWVCHPGDVSLFKKAVGSLVRYAPTTQQAIEVFYDFFENWDEPFRTMSTELVLFTNLIQVVSKGGHGTEAEMKDALRLIQIALRLGVLAIRPEHYDETFAPARTRRFSQQAPDNSREVFKSVCSKVLRYYNMDYTSDNLGLVKRDVVSQRSPH